MTVTLESLFNRDISKMTKTVCVGTEELEFKIRPLSKEEHLVIIEQTRGDRNADMECLFVAKACVEPNFNNSEFIKSQNALDGADLVSKCLLAGEIFTLAQDIAEFSGFGDPQKKIEEVKN